MYVKIMFIAYKELDKNQVIHLSSFMSDYHKMLGWNMFR